MQRLEVSGAVRPLYGPLGFKGLMVLSGGVLAPRGTGLFVEDSEEIGVVILRVKVSSKDISRPVASNTKHISSIFIL